MTVRVVAAFFDSGGLNAGTPLAMASTPVRATEPLANASQEEQDGQRLERRRRARQAGSWRVRPRPSTSDLVDAQADHEQGDAHEQVGRDGEDVARLPDARGGCPGSSAG